MFPSETSALSAISRSPVPWKPWVEKSASAAERIRSRWASWPSPARGDLRGARFGLPAGAPALGGFAVAEERSFMLERLRPLRDPVKAFLAFFLTGAHVARRGEFMREAPAAQR